MSATPTDWKETRSEHQRRRYGVVPMPEIGGSEIIAEAFVDLGKASFGAMGRGVLSWPDIQAYRQARPAITLDDARTLRAMSGAYLAGFELGADPLGIPPWQE